MVILCGLLLGAGLGATYEIHHFAKRLDTGAIVQADTTVAAPDTNGPVNLQLISVSFVWIAVPNAPGSLVEVRVIHPVVVISEMADCQSLTNDGTWMEVSLGDLIPCDENGTPLDWSYSSTGIIPTGIPAVLIRSSNMVDWDYVASVLAPGSFRDTAVDFHDGQQFYMTRMP
jgi:hypothetical protein